MYNSSKSTLSPSFELSYGHLALVAPLLSDQTFALVSKHLLALLYPLAPPSVPALALCAFVHLLLPLSILPSYITGPMSDYSSFCLDAPLQSI
ncbi:hypothetical protein Acr_00g0053580 [Actinidia rufa]|uniref:Uncharacterized protein n=1 Tax=Actinidia rufa TaxID=165716 RepID=A0A7J0DM04_9ERIC|nr:hypothetical protein Acr_00g0053580 [Actinidia rufa]